LSCIGGASLGLVWHCDMNVMRWLNYQNMVLLRVYYHMIALHSAMYHLPFRNSLLF
jgi:hypothetical protein